VNYALHPQAALEHEQQVAYYQERQFGLGQRYHSAFRAAVERACVTPEKHKKRFQVRIEKRRSENLTSLTFLFCFLPLRNN
jgi:hypothetical protein